nr:MAG TPA: hypothetical protein [Caudoviricetes sp.]
MYWLFPINYILYNPLNHYWMYSASSFPSKTESLNQ